MTLFEAIILTIITASTPLLIAAIGELVVERAGVLNLGVEGMMIIGAAAGIAAAITTGSSTLGVLVAVLAGMALSLVFAALVLGLAANQVAAGLALAILGLGLSGVIGAPFVGVQRAGIGKIETPLLSDIPFLGPLLFRQDPFVYASVALVIGVWWFLTKSRAGLVLRAVGENPHAVDTAGISVARLRYEAMLASGALCGIAGAYLSTAQSASFLREMTAGKGFLALAALIFGKWMPIPTLFACLIFAFADALQGRLQGVALPGIGVVPVQAIQALPYLLTILLLAGFVGKAHAPRASGIPYSKEK